LEDIGGQKKRREFRGGMVTQSGAITATLAPQSSAKEATMGTRGQDRQIDNIEFNELAVWSLQQ
jgi:hypothetical protein